MNEKEMTALTTSVGAEVGQSSQTNHVNSITQENEENNLLIGSTKPETM